ncbi:MAG: M20 family peptidase [Chloroflexi bacterium]|nr:M20 family peptidase [Chloroflexota bacterium]
MSNDELKTRVAAAIDGASAELLELSRRIHANPEVQYQEFKASTWLAENLERHGFQVERATGNLPTAFRAVRTGEKSGPTIAFLAEYDALPGVGHGCGHNLICTAALGAAYGVSAVLAGLNGTIQVMGTPAEEYFNQEEGKLKLLKAGAFAGVDASLMFHPGMTTGITSTDLAFVSVEVTYHGKPAHAAADPWNGRNALDGLILAYNNINALRQHVKPDVRIHGIITAGGEAPNIIPMRATGMFMVRSVDKVYLKEVYTRVVDCFQAAARATGTSVDIKDITWVDNTKRNYVIEDLTVENLHRLGIEKVPERPGGGSSDFGNVSQIMPGIQFSVKTHPEGIPWHSTQVTEGAIQELAHQGMLTAAKALAMTAVNLLADPEKMEKARRDFAAHN